MSKLIEVKLENPIANIESYKNFNPRIYAQLRKSAKKVRGLAVIHVNATAWGGGVAELLRSQIPCERALGIKSRWLRIRAPRYFFAITKKIHNLLQGKPGFLTDEEKKFYLKISAELEDSLRQYLKQFGQGLIVIHDPQPLPLVSQLEKNFLPIIRFHIDLSSSNASVLELLKPFVNACALVILSSPQYEKSFPWVPPKKLRVILPAIDPLALKNQPMPIEIAHRILEQMGINPEKTLITQISRFDPWKDPIGVLKSFYLAQNKMPNLHLALVGFQTAQDDPEAEEIFRRVKKHARGNPEIHLFSDTKQLEGLSNETFVSAVYTASTVVMQKSLREGFGLTVTEAMWKGKPVIAGRTSGTVLQIKNGKNGILVKSPESAAKAIIKLVKDEKLRERLGKAAHRSVQQKFLLPRFVLDNVKIYADLLRRE